MKVLIINSYAGSITIAAKKLGCDIVGSYEDHNFGMDIQRHNFPELNYIPHRIGWPRQDLSDTLVIAHPPCSAFSVQNCSPTARGVNSNAFACTKDVLRYAMENKALAVAVESVMGALAGAWKIHQHFADTYGYHVYRILENGIMFGCQWRERFWVVFVKKGAAHHDLPLTLAPAYHTVGEIIAGHEDGPSAGNQDRLLADQKKRLIEEAGLTPEEMSFYFDPQDPPHRTASLGTILWETKYKTPESTSKDKWNMFKKYIGGFASGTMVYLDPHGFSPTVMSGSFWYTNGRCLSEDAFKCIMGFPAEYVFPTTPRNFKGQIRMYLSKGVMPPIAEWVIRQLTLHLTGEHYGTDTLMPAVTHPPYTLVCRPNHIADFRITKAAWWNRHNKRPELRASEDLDERKIPSEEPVLVTCPRCQGGGRVVSLTLEVGDICGTCNGTGRVLDVPEPQPPKAHRPIRVASHPVRDTRDIHYVPRGRLSEVRIEVVSTDYPGDGLTEQRRRVVLEVVKELGTPTHGEAITAALTRVNILPATMHWHIRQLVKSGQLREVITS